MNCPFCNVEHGVLVPTVHSNGTAATELLNQYQGALDSIREAIKSVSAAAPNGRDYYVSRDGDQTQRAIKEHCIRMEKLTSVGLELNIIYEHLIEVIEFQAEHNKRERGGK